MTNVSNPSTALPQCRLLINGDWVAGETQVDVLDKFSLQPYQQAHIPSASQVKDAMAAGDAAFRANRHLTGYERGVILDRAAANIEERIPYIVEVLQHEAGFTATDATNEAKRCVVTFRLSAEEARRLHGDMIPMHGAQNQKGRVGFTFRVPLGVVSAITPFNAPLNTVAHKIAPALAAGNAVVLKPSLHTPMAGCFLAQVLIDAGLPKGLMTVLHGDGEIAEHMLSDQHTQFFAFTGSTAVGRKIQQQAGLRRTQMELGSIAFTILADDADLDKALPKIVNAAYRKAGQVCTSIQILLVHRSIQATVAQRLTDMVKALSYGDPKDPDTFVGPIISEASAIRIQQWIDEAIAGGATLLAGGTRNGTVVAPTLLTQVSDSMRVGCEEIFGPVMSIRPFDTLDEAIRRVNATPYGLATGLFTNRLDDAFEAARDLEVGGVHINETSSSRIDLMPYGGSKHSGFGREGPASSVREMTEERLITLSV